MATELKNKSLGEVLIETGIIQDAQYQLALLEQKRTGQSLTDVLKREGFVTDDQINRVLESHLGIKSLDLGKFFVEPDAVKMIPENICRKYTLVGVQISNGSLMIAMKDPLDYFALQDVRLMVKLPIQQVIASEKNIIHVIERFYSRTIAEKAVQDFITQYSGAQEQKTSKAESDAEVEGDVKNAPIVRFINSIIENAVRNGASDIHIEPNMVDVRIRIRIDGVLQETLRTNIETLNATVSRIKIMAELNIAEKRLPQDGRISYNVADKVIDLRVSTVPTRYGEKVVMRILDKSSFVVSKEKLGFREDDSKKFESLIRKPHGVIIVTGPTGSGKTSTLYAMLNELNSVEKNILTLEDPVEYDLMGINQVQLNVKGGLTFASGLRAFLRQDPDIIMIGEMRDSETAEIAVRAALTGHLVISTLHTNDAPSTITRIVDMGIEPFLISSSLMGVVAQRLVRKICTFCRVMYKPEERELRMLGSQDVENTVAYKGTGCQMCGGSGYKGRTAVFEIMVMDKKMRILIDSRCSVDELRDYAIQSGMTSLFDSCLVLVSKGVTTIDELMRISFNY